MQVIKRDGTIVAYNESRISDAVIAAMDDTIGGVDFPAVESITKSITQTIIDTKASIIQVEAIQNIVENTLMDSEHKEAAKQYILYRDRRNRERTIEEKEGILTKKFLKKYKHKRPPMSQLGEFVYYRTYSRWLPDKKRREEWWETVKRAVEYNCSLIPTSRKEAELLYDDIFNLRQFLAGRTLYTGNTEVSKKVPLSNFNCSHVIIDEFEALSDLFYLLLVGSGVGFRILKQDVEKLPKIRTDIKIIHEKYNPVLKRNRLENTGVSFVDKNTARITVGDSKHAWVYALRHFLELHYSELYSNITMIIINYDNVRPKGEPLQTFGGRASGHTSVQNMFEKISKVITDEGILKKTTHVKMRPINIMDMANIIAENVVVGGVNFLPRKNRMNCWKPDR